MTPQRERERERDHHHHHHHHHWNGQTEQKLALLPWLKKPWWKNNNRKTRMLSYNNLLQGETDVLIHALISAQQEWITIIPAENKQKNLLDHYCDLLLSKPPNPYTCKSGFTKHTVLLAFFLHQTRQNCSFPSSSSSSSPPGIFFYKTPWRDKSCTLAEAFTNPNWRLKKKRGKLVQSWKRKVHLSLLRADDDDDIHGIVKTNQKQGEKKKRNDKCDNDQNSIDILTRDLSYLRDDEKKRSGDHELASTTTTMMMLTLQVVIPWRSS